MSISDCADFLAELKLNSRDKKIAERVLKEVNERLRFLVDVGLDYLSLNRAAGTLSGGEAQRIRLATQIGSGLVGVLYVLDEPSIGLHQRDNHRLIETLVRLRDMGNTLIVVEHDEDTIKVADWVVDIGPGAGEHGGKVVAQRPVEATARQQGVDDRPVPVGQEADPDARTSAGPSTPARRLTVHGATREQPPGHRRVVPARRPHRRHRRIGLRQVDAGQRHPLHAPGPRAERRAQRARAAHAGRGRRPGRQGRARRPVAHRPHAAVQPGDVHRRLRPRPQAVRRDDGGQGPRATCRAASPSTSRAAAARTARATAPSRSR